MDSNAPRLAIASRIIGGLLILASIASWVFVSDDILADKYMDFLIYGFIALIIASFITSFWASRERKIPELSEGLSVEEQIASLESMPTQVRSSTTQVDQNGFETLNSQTQNIIQGIIGSNYEPSSGEVSAAIDSLTKGELGVRAAAEASANPAPHKHAVQIMESVVLDNNSDFDEQRTIPENIPLPNQTKTSLPDLSWMEKNAIFSTEVVTKEIPLPEKEGEHLSRNKVVKTFETPELPALDDLPELSELNGEVNVSVEEKISTPELPDLENLF